MTFSNLYEEYVNLIVSNTDKYSQLEVFSVPNEIKDFLLRSDEVITTYVTTEKNATLIGYYGPKSKTENKYTFVCWDLDFFGQGFKDFFYSAIKRNGAKLRPLNLSFLKNNYILDLQT